MSNNLRASAFEAVDLAIMDEMPNRKLAVLIIGWGSAEKEVATFWRQHMPSVVRGNPVRRTVDVSLPTANGDEDIPMPVQDSGVVVNFRDAAAARKLGASLMASSKGGARMMIVRVEGEDSLMDLILKDTVRDRVHVRQAQL